MIPMLNHRPAFHAYRYVCCSREDCIEALNDAIDRREEGIMVKDPESVYKPNVRKGGWFKMKPDYMSNYFFNVRHDAINQFLSERMLFV